MIQTLAAAVIVVAEFVVVMIVSEVAVITVGKVFVIVMGIVIALQGVLQQALQISNLQQLL